MPPVQETAEELGHDPGAVTDGDSDSGEDWKGVVAVNESRVAT
ncbi:MAG TPA: hypothetical protein VHX20_15885 [Terracidiphilus sp.]|nr:hypothetical protein [Terracidiphilus sp.]